MMYAFTYLYLFQFLSSMSYSFLSTGLFPSWLNLFLTTYFFCYNSKWDCFLNFSFWELIIGLYKWYQFLSMVFVEDITLVNMYAPNIGACKYIYKKKPLMNFKREIDCKSVIVGTLTPQLHQWTDLPDQKWTPKRIRNRTTRKSKSK